MRVRITRVFMRKVRKIEIWFFREKAFITISRVIENMAEVDYRLHMLYVKSGIFQWSCRRVGGERGRERGERGNNSIIIGFQSINCREKSGTCIDDSPTRKC